MQICRENYNCISNMFMFLGIRISYRQTKKCSGCDPSWQNPTHFLMFTAQNHLICYRPLFWHRPLASSSIYFTMTAKDQKLILMSPSKVCLAIQWAHSANKLLLKYHHTCPQMNHLGVISLNMIQLEKVLWNATQLQLDDRIHLTTF